ncbi:MAG: hypothetical protein LC115_01915 [Bacteroidia bacterium]|nr:hypothetical protein [Bacteroidia bacterium]
MLRFISIVTIIMTFCSGRVFSQIEQTVGAKTSAFSGFGSAGNGDPNLLLTNPAGICGITSFSASLSAGQPYFLDAFNTAALTAVLPIQNHYAGITAYSRGNNLFRQTQISAAYAISLFDNKFRGGIKIGGYNTHIPEYGAQTSLIIDAGVQTSISKSIDIGARVTNLNQARLKINREEPLPTVLSVGALWKVGKTFSVAAEAYQSSIWPLDMRVGLEYKPHPILAIRLGARTEPFVYTAGIGLKWKSYQLDFSMERHLLLGFTPQFSFSYLVNRPSNEKQQTTKP